MSIDGFLATKEDDLSWLSIAEKEGEDYGYAAFNQTVDTYLVGRKTYEVVTQLTGGTFPPADQHTCFVITRQQRDSTNGITFYSGDVPALIAQLKTQPGKNIYCDGGGQLVQLLMKEHLIDEYIVSIIPIVLGNGKRLFLGDTAQFELTTMPPKFFETGVIQLHYVRKTF